MDVLASGYPSLDTIIPVSHSPSVGQTALMQLAPDDHAATFGGCGANVAVGLRRLGFSAGVGMIIGDDARGIRYRDYLQGLGINLANLIVLPGQKTSCSFLFRNPEGEYQNFFFAGAADAWQGTLNLCDLEGLRYGLVTVGSYHYNRQFAEAIHAQNIPLIWQLKPDIFAFPADGMARFAEISHIILMNHLEAEFVLQSLGFAAPSELLNDTTRAVVITRGAAGIHIYSADGEEFVPAVAADVTDSTGAGDGFTTGFLAGLLRGESLLKCAQIGGVVASFVLEKIGCQTNLPDVQQMQIRYKEFFGE
jgi:sugar/nucleoside kinase (ribokinase family)